MLILSISPIKLLFGYPLCLQTWCQVDFGSLKEWSTAPGLSRRCRVLFTFLSYWKGNSSWTCRHRSDANVQLWQPLYAHCTWRNVSTCYSMMTTINWIYMGRFNVVFSFVYILISCNSWNIQCWHSIQYNCIFQRWMYSCLVTTANPVMAEWQTSRLD